MTLHKKAELFDLISRDPGEMGFIEQSETYDDYVATFYDAKLGPDDVVYTKEEFKKLKEGFKEASKNVKSKI